MFDAGDEVMAGLRDFARRSGLTASQFTAIGAFKSAILAFFSFEKGDYKRIPVSEQTEVLSLVGDVTLKEGQPLIHAHVVLGKSDGTAHGGHLMEACVRPTLEVVLTEAPRHLIRKHDPQTGLSLIDLQQA